MNLESIHNLSSVLLFLLVTVFSYHHLSPVSGRLSVICYLNSFFGSINVNDATAISNNGTYIQMPNQVFTSIQLPKREL